MPENSLSGRVGVQVPAILLARRLCRNPGRGPRPMTDNEDSQGSVTTQQPARWESPSALCVMEADLTSDLGVTG